MKGVLFNVVEEGAVALWGRDTWDDLIDDSGVGGAYTSLGSYPDEELGVIVAAACERTGLDPATLVRLLGRAGFAGLASRHGDLVAGYATSRHLLLALDDVIHPEVLKLYPHAQVPVFTVLENTPNGVLRLEYASPRGLCALAEGLALGAADHYGDQVDVHQSSCRHRGDPSCIIEVTPSGPGAG